MMAQLIAASSPGLKITLIKPGSFDGTTGRWVRSGNGGVLVTELACCIYWCSLLRPLAFRLSSYSVSGSEHSGNDQIMLNYRIGALRGCSVVLNEQKAAKPEH